jgi:Family of unknown function (DUF6464)
MLEITAILFIGVLPGLCSLVAVRKLRNHAYRRFEAVRSPAIELCHARSSCFQMLDYQYIEGVGYMVGDITCKYNAHSAYLRCAVNPSGPCQGCSQYESKL